MKRAIKTVLISFALLSFISPVVQGQITRTATFDAYPAGKDLGTSFTDLASGIAFSNATSSIPRFTVNAGLPETGETNYIGSGGGGWSLGIGFTANLLLPANQVSILATFESGNSSQILLEGFSGANGTGTLIAQESISNASDPYTLQISSSQYNIESFQIVAHSVFTGYDNISYTILPEPSLVLLLPAGMGIHLWWRPRQDRAVL